MRHTARIISIHASDTAGVCSMLYELGGMTVVHDASGCNSTYATHDEPRWQHRPGNIFISALTETDAILGNDEKFIADVTETALALRPRFIAICCAPVPVMVGTDMYALALEIENRSGLPTMAIATSGIGSWLDGASAALQALCRRFCVEQTAKPDTINILGATPLDLSRLDSPARLRAWAAEYGLKVNSIMAMDSTLDEISGAAGASANLVISASGLAAARYLEQRFGTPFVTAFPAGIKFSAMVAAALRNPQESRLDSAEDELPLPPDAPVIVGEPVFSVSLARALHLESGIAARVISPFSAFSGILRPRDIICEDEVGLQEEFQRASALYADPMYLPIWDKSKPFHALPTYAFSGRCYRRHFPITINTAPDFSAALHDFTTCPQESIC